MTEAPASRGKAQDSRLEAWAWSVFVIVERVRGA